MNKLHPGARWIFRLRAYSRFAGLFFVAIYFTISMSLRASQNSWITSSFTTTLSLIIFLGILVVILFGEIYSRMSYNRFLYDIGPDSVKLEKGIIWKKYTSIPYERVQNVDIKRGIIARILGFSTVEIETAGQSGMRTQAFSRRRQRYMSEGHLPAIEINQAEEIRKFVMDKIKNKKDSGI